MSLSKSSNYLTLLLEIYNGHLRKTPLLTKSITSGVLSFAGALVASYLRVIFIILIFILWSKYFISYHYNPKKFQGSSHSGLLKNTGPFTIYGLVVAGPVTHYFYNFLEKILANNTIGKILFERLVFCPIFLLFTLYILQRLQVIVKNNEKGWIMTVQILKTKLRLNETSIRHSIQIKSDMKQEDS